ncbi:MAG: DNA-3-methyladenine glycosylase 2 family protein [Fimbriimonadaceae bacterium]|nr:DNA-3-methyladenine glycosylase 2 family protein [Chitinophagales bacterium]
MHYLNHLSKDKKLKKLIEQHGTFELKKEKNICLFLCYSIMSQQLSTKVAAVFHKRFVDLFKGKEPSAKQIATTKFETLRAIGLSNAKANYVLNVANFELENGMSAKKLQEMEDEEIITYLTQIKGVGRWTVEMLLMFALAREDHFAADDLGLQTAMIKLYKLDNSDKKQFKEDMLRISKKWSPYRTYASLYLWRFKDVK